MIHKAREAAPPTIVVVGSVNLDIVAACPRLPTPGETVTDATLSRYPGGKGANQALAALRQGAEVTLIAAVGIDSLAGEALEILRDGGVDLSRLVAVDGRSTGVALIVVDQNGENQIAVAPGANRHLQPNDIDTHGFDAVLCQLEINDDAVVAAARGATGLFCVNAAPARPVPGLILERADLIIVNEIEHQTLHDQLMSFESLLVVTRGARGADAFRQGELIATAQPPPIVAVDTVGAGDAFCGTLVVNLARGARIENALQWACRAGAVAATRVGAQPSLPTREELAGHPG
jgi:ribokinase